jgi:hypothetical protein
MNFDILFFIHSLPQAQGGQTVMSTEVRSVGAAVDGQFAFADGVGQASERRESGSAIAVERSASGSQENGAIVERKSFSKISLLVLLIPDSLHFFRIQTVGCQCLLDQQTLTHCNNIPQGRAPLPLCCYCSSSSFSS